MKITVCTFKRKRGGLTEWGIILDDEKLIIDREAKPVQMVYTYDLHPHEGSMFVQLHEPFEKGVQK